MVSGMLGLDGDALEATLTVCPHIPQNWTVQFDNFRVGKSNASGTIARSQGAMRISLSISGQPLRVVLAPAFAAGAKMVRVEVNGAQVVPQVLDTAADVHIRFGTAAVSSVEAVFKLEEPAEPAPVLKNPQPGDPAASH
jgi:hypothetical protein